MNKAPTRLSLKNLGQFWLVRFPSLVFTRKKKKKSALGSWWVPSGQFMRVLRFAASSDFFFPCTPCVSKTPPLSGRLHSLCIGRRQVGRTIKQRTVDFFTFFLLLSTLSRQQIKALPFFSPPLSSLLNSALNFPSLPLHSHHTP